MIVIDTHAWLWWIAAPRELSESARDAIAASDGIIVPAIACWEVAMLEAKGRVTLNTDVLDFVLSALRWDRVSLQALTPEIAVRAARLPVTVGLDPCDRQIAATAIELDLPLVTRDRKLRESGALRCIW